MELRNGALQWSSTMELYNGALQWSSAMELSNGALQWSTPMELSSGALKLHVSAWGTVDRATIERELLPMRLPRQRMRVILLWDMEKTFELWWCIVLVFEWKRRKQQRKFYARVQFVVAPPRVITLRWFFPEVTKWLEFLCLCFWLPQLN